MINLVEQLINPITKILDKVVPDAAERIRLAHEIATLTERQAHEIAKGQLEINKNEATHKNMFVAGWRPAVGWTCVLGLNMNFFIIPATNFISELKGSAVEIPLVDMATMMPLLFGLLGLGAYRTVEKIKGVSREK